MLPSPSVPACPWAGEEPLPAGTEARLAGFTELAATAIANAEAQAALTASRATADATRRRIERNLHDGARQRLVSLALDITLPLNDPTGAGLPYGASAGRCRPRLHC